MKNRYRHGVAASKSLGIFLLLMPRYHNTLRTVIVDHSYCSQQIYLSLRGYTTEKPQALSCIVNAYPYSSFPQFME